MAFFFILFLATFYAANMGGSSFAGCFAATYGGKIVTHKKALILFCIFVILGSVTFGGNVSRTLGNDIIPAALFNPKTIALIFFTGGLGMYIANLMHIPQSTSLVAVAAIAGVGIQKQALNIATILNFSFFWVLLPLLSFALTYFVTSRVYPPRKENFWVYEQIVNREGKLKKFVIFLGCYNAFAIGTNNVPNVVGPLQGEIPFSLVFQLMIFAVIYGFGGFIFRGPLKTMGDKIVPLGLLTVSIISLITGTLMLIASALGIPQSFVMLQIGSLFAVSALKHGNELTWENPITKKTLVTWAINPLIVFLVTWGLMGLFKL